MREKATKVMGDSTVTLRTRSGNAVRKHFRFQQWLSQGKRCAICNAEVEFADCRFETPNTFTEGETNRILCKRCQEKVLSRRRQGVPDAVEVEGCQTTHEESAVEQSKASVVQSCEFGPSTDW